MATRIINVTYRVTTPMFCGGADGRTTELRLPSFKGVLRYWWRALAWSDFDGNLDRIKKEEDDLFGSAKGGQSQVSMRLESPPSLQRRGADQVLMVPCTMKPVGHGARYLGYGVMDAFANKRKNREAGQLTRACIEGGFNFTVQMRLWGVPDESVALLRRALIAVGCLGGLGAKSRKGYGSVAIRSLIVDEKPRSMPRAIEDLRTQIADLCPPATSTVDPEYPEYTAFSRHARHVLLTSKMTEPLELLDLVGREIIRYRSWGRNGKILGEIDSEKIFKQDHDLMNRVGDGGRRDGAHPERVAFGLPHNYGRGPRHQVVPVNGDRRASPLFIHIHECDECPVAVLSFLPARFLPKGQRGDQRIRVGGHSVRQKPEEELYEPVTRFLDRLLNQGKGVAGKRKEPFVEAVEVGP